MNKTIKVILAAAGALVLGGLGEGIGAELLKKAAKTTDDDTTAEETNEDITVKEPIEVEAEEVTDETED